MLSDEQRQKLYGFDFPDLSLKSVQRFGSASLDEVKAKLENQGDGSLDTTGTTVVALRYENGVVMAADRQTTSGHRDISARNTTKIEHLDGHRSLIGMAGMVAYIQELKKVFERTVSRFRRLVETPIYVDGQAEILAHILRANFRNFTILNLLGYAAHPLLAGWDPEYDEGRIFSFDGAGGTYEAKEGDGYRTVGSGGKYARTILDDRWQNGMSQKDAMVLAIRSILRSSSRDAFTSPAQLDPLTVYSMSENGLQYLTPENALAIAWEIYNHDLDRTGDVGRFNFFVAGSIDGEEGGEG